MSLKQDESVEIEFKAKVFRFGRTPLIIYLAFLGAFVPISVDLYLPSLADMPTIFNCSKSLASFTLSGFMLFFALSMLVWGGLSDKYGRKIVLNIGLVVYIAGSVLCVFAQSIHMLIAGRILQAIGSGAVCSVSMAIVKDCFKGIIMEKVLVWIQAMTVLCPMLAPSLGAVMLLYTSWRGLFVILMLCAVIALGLGLFLNETHTNRLTGSALASLGRISFVLSNKGFRWLLVLFSMGAMPFMAYLTSSTFIYTKLFNLSKQEFSVFFAANACFALLGPLLYSRFFRNFNRGRFLGSVYCILIASGTGLILFGSRGPLWFLCLYAPLTLFTSSSRPLGTVLMMTQLDSDNGTVSALIGSCSLLFGSFAMMICSLDLGMPIIPVACIAIAVGVVSLILWGWLHHNKIYRDPYRSSKKNKNNFLKKRVDERLS